MYNSLKNNKTIAIFNKISILDFDKFYNYKIRLLLHLGMWFSFSVLLFLNYFLEFDLSVYSGLILTARAMISNIAVFYLFFYLLPNFIVIDGVFANVLWILFSFIILVIIWLLINYLQLRILHKLGVEISEPPFKGLIAKNAKQDVSAAISLTNILGNASLVLFSIMPSFFSKAIFDITRLYSNTLKIEKHKRTLEIQNINIEKNFLKSQLNPHFLFNTLNNLYGLTKQKDEKASEIVLSLSDIMSYTLYYSESEKVPLKKELEFIENYYSIEKMRHIDDKNISLSIEEIGNTESIFIAPLLTFSLIENAFKYGLKSRTNPFLHISIVVSEDKFIFNLKNDKSNLPVNSSLTKANSKYGGIGITNLQRRLKLLYPDKHILKIKNEIDRYSVEMQINLR